MAKALATKNPVSERMRSIRRVLWVILVLNLAVAAAKYVYGLMSGSASMQADGIHSVFDSAGNVVGLVGIALAARPADDSHPYGHAKFETYASLVIGVLLLLAAFEVGSSAVGKLVSGVYTAEVTPVSFIVMVGTLAVNIGVTTYERRCAKRLKSEVLAADANHTLSDALAELLHEDICPVCGHHHDHHDGECGCGHHHDHEGHHHADDVFTSWGVETAHKFTEDELKEILDKLAKGGEYGEVLRAKGIVTPAEGEWFHFDLVPEETELRRGAADYTGRICVIGANLNEDKLKELFHV